MWIKGGTKTAKPIGPAANEPHEDGNENHKEEIHPDSGLGHAGEGDEAGAEGDGITWTAQRSAPIMRVTVQKLTPHPDAIRGRSERCCLIGQDIFQ